MPDTHRDIDQQAWDRFAAVAMKYCLDEYEINSGTRIVEEIEDAANFADYMMAERAKRIAARKAVGDE